jgi:hypothetical protein
MMEHKAFLFNYQSFDRELRAVLEDALRSGDHGSLVSFINAHLVDLRDPYEGEPLGANWEALIETQDPHQFGDFALTKYYNPTADIGVAAAWENLQELIAKNDPLLAESPILGSTIGPKDNAFDPGKMGSYFQSAQQVRQSQSYLLNLAKEKPAEVLSGALAMLQEAADAGTGLYVTF